MASSVPEQMRAAVSHLPESTDPAVTVDSVPTPTPKEGELLVRVRAAGVNNFDASNALLNRFRRTKPVVLGRDFSGQVVQAPGNPQLVGKRVAGAGAEGASLDENGSHAEYFVVPAAGAAIIPDNVSDVAAASLGVPWTTAWMMLERTEVRQRNDGDSQLSIVVLGATGGVGKAAVQLARLRGHRVITTSRRDGADVNTTTDPQLSKVGELTGGKGADVILDTVGLPELVAAALNVLARDGRYAVIAVKAAGHAYAIDFSQFYSRNQSIHGVVVLRLKPDRVGKIIQEVLDLAGSGKLDLGPDSAFQLVKLADAPAMYPKIKVDGTKYVVVVD